VIRATQVHVTITYSGGVSAPSHPEPRPPDRFRSRRQLSTLLKAAAALPLVLGVLVAAAWVDYWHAMPESLPPSVWAGSTQTEGIYSLHRDDGSRLRNRDVFVGMDSKIGPLTPLGSRLFAYDGRAPGATQHRYTTRRVRPWW
jgi:hypothetical protein